MSSSRPTAIDRSRDQFTTENASLTDEQPLLGLRSGAVTQQGFRHTWLHSCPNFGTALKQGPPLASGAPWGCFCRACSWSLI